MTASRPGPARTWAAACLAPFRKHLGAVPHALLACSLLAACFEDPGHGGTDDVDNPALTATLRASGGQGLAGTVRVFARYQNPVRDSQPVLTVPAGEAGGAAITPMGPRDQCPPRPKPPCQPRPHPPRPGPGRRWICASATSAIS